MNKNTILIVMPIYNAEKTLEAAIESIMNQAYTNIYLILVNDASTDSSLDIANRYKYKYPNIDIINNKKNKGAYYCRNIGLYKYQNDKWGYFTTHDSDDISFPDRYENLLKLMKTKRNINGVQEIFERVDLESGRTISAKFTMAHALFTRDVFKNLGYFDTVRFGADWEHWARLKEFNKANGFVTTGLNKVTGISYVHKNNLTIQIPIGSHLRSRYVAKSTQRIQKMSNSGNFYMSFYPESRHINA